MSDFKLSKSDAPATEEVLVTRVIDGDTIEIEGAEHVRPSRTYMRSERKRGTGGYRPSFFATNRMDSKQEK